MPLVISPGHSAGGGKGLCCVPGRIHKGESGPITTFALRAGEKPKGARPKWDARHQNDGKNDLQHMNMRNYFDRPVARPDLPIVPRPRLRPHWTLDIPKDPKAEGVYRVFDAREAKFKDQWQWIPATADADATDTEVFGGSSAGATASRAKKSASAPHLQPPKPRTPRAPEDLKKQRGHESNWNKHHGSVFSRFNGGNHPDFRSYFDRWKDDPSQLGKDGNNPLPTWKRRDALTIGRAAAANADPLKDRGGLPGQPGWQNDF